MAERISQIVTALNKLGSEVENGGSAHGASTMRALWGWNQPPLNAKQMGYLANSLANKISKISESSLNPKFTSDSILAAIDDFTGNTLQYIWNGNGNNAAPQYFALLNWIDSVFEPVYEVKTDWQKLADDGMFPKKIAAKIRSYSARIDRFDVDFETLGEKIKYINEAHEAAEALPTDLESLRGATEEVADSRASAEKSRILAEAALEEAQALLASIQRSEGEARKLVENTEDAYSAATTRGLGEAFQRRADRTARSMWVWVAGLLLALIVGAIAGHIRVASLQDLIAKDAGAGAITLSVALAALSVAAPIWFAWIATKQIGHRFRLSEDYAFKASVAQAYEGYRREAARVDADFAKRLFSSALDRLDEAPIRFVEHETFGSPWHEFVRGRQSKKDETASRPVKPIQGDNDDEAAA